MFRFGKRCKLEFAGDRTIHAAQFRRATIEIRINRCNALIEL